MKLLVCNLWFKSLTNNTFVDYAQKLESGLLDVEHVDMYFNVLNLYFIGRFVQSTLLNDLYIE